jgi:hypothetical protein
MLGMLSDRLHERGYMVRVRVRFPRACFDGPAYASGLARTTSGTASATGVRSAREEHGVALSSSGVTCPRWWAAGVAHST